MTAYLRNGYLFILPILLWNWAFFDQLPSAYAPHSFNQDIPLWVLWGEGVTRVILFGLPLFLQLNWHTNQGRRGLWVTVIGILLYFLSWLALIYAPESNWSTSFLGFTAPAYTPLLWIVGIGLVSERYYWSRINYYPLQFLIPSLLFWVFHVIHATIVYQRM